MKLIIDVDEDNYKAICSDKGYSYANTMWWIIRNGTPYNPTGDCISREALKEKLKERYYNDGLNIVTAIELIDNAPTMPLPNEQIAWEQGYEIGLAQGKQDRPQGDILQKIPKDFVYDTETSEFYCYRNKYTGKEIHIVKNPPTYVLDKRPQGDLISREALKDITYINKGNFNTVEGIREWIDNAPPVDLWQMRQEATENALKKAEVLYGRPKRKWIECRSSDHWKCDECGHPAPLESRDCEWLSNFCPNCGADMRKGGAE